MGRLRFQERPRSQEPGARRPRGFQETRLDPRGALPPAGQTESAWPCDPAHLLPAHLLPAPPPSPARRARPPRPPRPGRRSASSALVLAVASSVWWRLVGVLIRFSRVACLWRDVACLSRASLPPPCARGRTGSASPGVCRVVPSRPVDAESAAHHVGPGHARAAWLPESGRRFRGENPAPSAWTSRPELSRVCSSRFCLFRAALLSRPLLTSGLSPTGATADLPGEGLTLGDPWRSGGEAGATVTAQGDTGLAPPARALGPFAFLTVALGDPGGPCATCTWRAHTWGVVLGASILGPSAHSSSHGLEARSPGLWRGAAAQGCRGDPPRPLSGSRCFAGRLCCSLVSGAVAAAPAPPAHGVPLRARSRRQLLPLGAFPLRACSWQQLLPLGAFPRVHVPVGSSSPWGVPPPPRACSRRQRLLLEGQRCHLIQKDLLLHAAAKTPFRVGSHLQWGLGFDVTPGERDVGHERDMGHRQGRWRLPGLRPRPVGWTCPLKSSTQSAGGEAGC